MSWRALISRHIVELRFHYNPELIEAKALTNFISNNYADLKTLNPTFPFSVRPGPFTQIDDRALVRALYDYGVEEEVDTSNFTEEEVENVLRDMVLKGATLRRFPYTRKTHEWNDVVDAGYDYYVERDARNDRDMYYHANVDPLKTDIELDQEDNQRIENLHKETKAKEERKIVVSALLNAVELLNEAKMGKNPTTQSGQEELALVNQLQITPNVISKLSHTENETLADDLAYYIETGVTRGDVGLASELEKFRNTQLETLTNVYQHRTLFASEWKN